MMKLANGNRLHGRPVEIELPHTQPLDNLLSEKMMFEVTGPSGQALGRGQGTMSGQINLSRNIALSDRGYRGNIPYPPSRHLSIDSLRTDPKLKTTYQFDVGLTPLDPDSWVRDGEVEYDLDQLVSLPTFGDPVEMVQVNSLLPYPHIAQMDIHLHFSEPIELAQNEVLFENAIGNLMISCTLDQESNSVHWQLQHTLMNTWLDARSHRDYSELMAYLGNPDNYRVKVKRIGATH